MGSNCPQVPLDTQTFAAWSQGPRESSPLLLPPWGQPSPQRRVTSTGDLAKGNAGKVLNRGKVEGPDPLGYPGRGHTRVKH